MRTLVWLSFIASVTVSTVHCSRLPEDDRVFEFDEEYVDQQRRKRYTPMHNAGTAAKLASDLGEDDLLKKSNSLQKKWLSPEAVAAKEEELDRISSGSKLILDQVAVVRAIYANPEAIKERKGRDAIVALYQVFSEEGLLQRNDGRKAR